MGCFCPKEDPLVILNRVRNNLLTQIELNKIKIEKREKNIQDLDNQINQLENDLKQNQYSYSDTEKKQKARQIMGLKKDLLLEEKGLEEARTYNETLNNNKTTIESKIEEIRNMQAISAGDKALANLGDGNTAEILQSNVERMMREQQIRDQNLAILKNGNNAINAGLGFKDEDDYLKNLLGNNGNAGGAPVFY
jgi:DNA repair exonuclease SbcCD ATPase subunit